ncbi:PTS system D-mannitol-specific IIA component, Fru family [Alteribacillus persepolensis]|uniref:Mannitol-specific phosphotransferase enzyme IIA component n=1 Tax=Alteribacillus persepolensis TaxID=568899 RepID=A0A1G8GBZ7_9BACI|nr:PTS sugar transporter subunit IIA [Alteribacillus persepolensis]SDH91846.1 PTS system D-mannitol-specific IIA component, Fru family [Alteribacillus persepolensis]
MEKSILNESNVEMNVALNNKEEAIRKTGDILAGQGYVEPAYVDAMLEREEVTSTYMGNYVAIPHGTEEAKEQIKASGLSIVHAPEGVDFGDGNIVKILIGIAGKDNEHLDILSKIAIVCSEEENIEKMIQANSKQELLALFEEVV